MTKGKVFSKVALFVYFTYSAERLSRVLFGFYQFSFPKLKTIFYYGSEPRLHPELDYQLSRFGRFWGAQHRTAEEPRTRNGQSKVISFPKLDE